MQNYFDLSQQERAELSGQELEDHINFALMEAGIKIPQKPRLKSEPDAIELKTTRKYRLYGSTEKNETHYGSYSQLNIVLDSSEQADALINLSPGITSSGSTGEFKRIRSFRVELVDVPTAESLEKNKEAMKARQSINDYNNQETKRYKEEVDASDNIRMTTISDHQDCQYLKQALENLRDTYLQYCEMTGDKSRALGYLRKLKDVDQGEIDQAIEWGLIDNPLPPEAPADEQEQLAA